MIQFETFTFPKDPSVFFDFHKPPFDPLDFAQNLIKTIYNNNAICIAAPQINVMYNVFAMRGSPQNYVCFNPRVVFEDPETSEMEETSLSCPKFNIKIPRSRKIRVRFQTPNGEMRTETFMDLTARAFLHNMDFLAGKKFWSSVSKIKFDIARRKANVPELYYK